ncbi:MAG: DUF4258 domain-containing protein [Candidatus Scalindua sp. AMX11]|nr:MAG: DUF4258 domain-containing protein [Candidatus Scalindua sp.]NOG86039.1 DUF4258 domain-containing protein [Planctomycetota bacterium]RZV91338.1 MAG: DUF4258 domain-containing protein [Candidatus Scalindua sp. SCAELEC01]TDE65895.1 MAG: DUF4258 domain-containing protein [Candidatus Scalindua sp. AMX11]GJQ60753.1 MAG: hypothetical protein SCALA701_35540 [Candidatus Scalindua sp.]
MNIREIREKFSSDEYEISFHAEKERYAEDIKNSDIENVISNCEIIEVYPDDPRGTSCLILGYSEERPIHIVCGFTLIKWLRIITFYIPKLPKWIDERTRAKEGGSDA